MAIDVEMVKCACADCVCVVSTGKALKADGRMFCGEACASHHQGSAGCDHAGCSCHG